jgi:antitoxin ParD1/3/4
MNVSLTPKLEKFVSAKVRAGRYNSASEVVREALRLLEEHDQDRAKQLAGFNRELGHRLTALDRGEHVDPAKARAQLRERSERRGNEKRLKRKSKERRPVARERRDNE